MTWFDLIQYYFDKDIYTLKDVAQFVVNGQITSADYESITHTRYEASESK